MLIKFKLDYGAIIYGAARENLLKRSDVLPNEAIGVATLLSFQEMIDEMSLKYRKEMHTLKCFSRWIYSLLSSIVVNISTILVHWFGLVD